MQHRNELEEEKAAYEIKFLDPKRCRFYRDNDEELRLDITDDLTILSVTAFCAFPLTDPEHYIGIVDGLGNEVGMLQDLRHLDHASRMEVEEELRRRYFVPKIERINSIRIEFGIVYWEVETDKGARDFVIRGIRDSVFEISPGRFLIQDVDANRFEIPDASRLDHKSQLWLERLI